MTTEKARIGCRMKRVALTVGVLLAVVLAGCSAPFIDASAKVTVENQRSQTYELTVYVVEEAVGAGNISFRATDRSGVAKTVELVELDSDGNLSNVTLAGRWNATVTEIPVPPNRTTNATLNRWEPGDAIVYAVATPNGQLVRIEYDECARPTVRSRFVFSEGPENGYYMACTE